jgi:rare lipoprotein A
VKLWLVVILSLVLAGCGTVRHRAGSDGPPARDDPDRPNLDAIADAVPRAEALIPGPNKPYTVLGESYRPETGNRPYAERGMATWYGRKFHGNRTASGELYNMYAMTAAHRTLPVPSYARVTVPATGKSIVVRINDRGPFVKGRVIDLSYAAAYKLGVLGGETPVLVERVFPGEPAMTPAAKAAAPEVDASRPTGTLQLQAGVFAQAANAKTLAERIRSAVPALSDRVTVQATNDRWRVLIGPFPDESSRAAASLQLTERLDIAPVNFR